MKKKILLSIGVLVLSLSAVFAHTIPVHTSCGRTTSLESSDYADFDEMMVAVQNMDVALCG